METTYRKSKGNAGLEGVQFQLNLLTVFLLNALRSLKNWKISTENQNAGKFDDIVLEMPRKSILLQTKFKQSKKISKDQLFSCNPKNADFSLPKYFFSYLEVKSASVEKNVIVCTSTNIDEKEMEQFLTRHVVETNSMLHYKGDIYPYFTFNENILADLKISAENYLDTNLQSNGIDKLVVTHENLIDFLDHFQFFSNYPSGDKLDAIIRQLLSQLNNSSLYCKVSSQEIFKKVEDWFKQPKGEYLTELRAKAMFSEIKSDKYCEELRNYNVPFRDVVLNDTHPKRMFFINADGRYLLQALKIYHALQNDETKKLYVSPDDDFEVQKRAIEAFTLRRYTFLIMIAPKLVQEIVLKEISEQLKDILAKNAYKKVILVAEPNDLLCQQIGANDILHIDESVTFNDLSQECQHRLIEEKNIIFQGARISLEELLAKQTCKDWARAVNSETLEKLITKQEIKVGVPLTSNKPISRYYIHRTFNRQARNIRSKKESREESFPEENIYDVNEDAILISDSAGMGKSTVLSQLATTIKEKNPHLWVIKIALTEYTNILRDIKTSGVSISATKLLNFKKATRLRNHLERYVFSMNEKVVLMLDGIDEISPDYTGLILSLLRQCLQSVNISKLFVTTRPHMVRELREVLKAKPLVLEPFTGQNQVYFLTSFWMHNLNLDHDNKGKCEQYAKAVISRMSRWTKPYRYYKDNNFTAIPLQLRMLAEIFQESIYSSDWEGCKEYMNENREKPKLPERLEIKELYDIFIKKKKDIYVYKGNPGGNSAANMALIKQFDESLTYHKKFALEVILHKEYCELFSCYRLDCEDIRESMLMIGIVQRSNEEYSFIHRTFAEYFVAASLVDELQIQLRNPNVQFQKLFLEDILTQPEYKTIRSFLDNFLQKVINSIPSNVFEEYHTQIQYPNDSTRGTNLLHLLGEEGCTTILQLILNCVDFKMVLDKEINIADLQKQKSNTEKNVFQSLAKKVRARKEKGGNILKTLQILVQEAGINIKHTFGQTPLHCAAASGHFRMVKFLVERGAKIDSVDNEGHTALHFVATTDDLNSIKYLIKSNDDVNVRNNNGLTPLHCAAANGRLDTLKLLVELGADFSVEDNYGRTLIHLAASRGDLSTVKFLFQFGIYVDVEDTYKRTPLYLAASNGHLDVVKFFLEVGGNYNVRDNYNRTPMHMAAWNGHLETVRYLLELGVSLNTVDNCGHTPLHLAASSGHLETVKFLLESGANFNAKDKDGCMVINLAALCGQLETVKLFLGLGLHFNVADKYGRKLLHFASSSGHLNTVRFLLGLGVDVNTKDNSGRTPLHFAAWAGHLEVVKYFLKLGADIDARDEGGNTALHLAASSSHWNVVKFGKE